MMYCFVDSLRWLRCVDFFGNKVIFASVKNRRLYYNLSSQATVTSSHEPSLTVAEMCIISSAKRAFHRGTKSRKPLVDLHIETSSIATSTTGTKTSHHWPLHFLNRYQLQQNQLPNSFSIGALKCWIIFTSSDHLRQTNETKRHHTVTVLSRCINERKMTICTSRIEIADSLQDATLTFSQRKLETKPRYIGFLSIKTVAGNESTIS